MATFAPTLAQQDLILAFQDQLSLYGHTLTSTGTNSFDCLLTPANPAEPEFMEIFKDAREVSIASALRTSITNGITAQTTLTDEMGQQWVTINRVDNPSQITVEFWMTKVASVDT